MCSIGEDDFGDEGGLHSMVCNIAAEDESVDLNEKLCNKCKNPQAIYKLPFREPECKECFLHYARHKFRAALGSSKILPKDANVVLVYDGCAPSLVLLDMLHHAQKQNAFKRLHCNLTVLYIDDYKLIQGDEQTTDNYRKLLSSIRSVLQQYSGAFKCFIMPLVHIKNAKDFIFPLDLLDEEYITQALETETQAVLNSINAIKSLTSRQDFVKNYRSKLIAEAAKYFKCQFAFMADISSDLASDLLSAIALGRGGSAAMDVALIDDRLGDNVQLCRPLKDLSVAEIDLYVKAQQLHVLQCKRYGDNDDSSASLQNLTKAFVSNLQENFSSTVSTVFRTGNKIASNRDVNSLLTNVGINADTSNPLYCSFCNSVLDYRVSTTLLAIEFSRVVSERCNTTNKCVELNDTAEKNLLGSQKGENMRNLCHGCRNIYADTSDKLLLL